MTRILVTGGAGYVGSVSVAALVAAGHSVMVLDDLTTGHAAAVPAGAVLRRGSYTDEASVRSLLVASRIEAILHCAARSLVGESIREPAAYYRDNVAGGVALLEAARKTGVKRFVFSSTAAVYGTPDDTPISEDAPLRPINTYGETKRTFEGALRWYGGAYGMRGVVLRYFNVAGADPFGRVGLATVGATHLLKIAVEAATGQRAKVDVFGTDYPTRDGSCIRDFIHVSDLAQAHRAALSYLRGGGSSVTLNCGYGRGYSVLETLEAVRRISSSNFAVHYAPRRRGDVMTMVADTSRIRSTLDWNPRYDDLDTIAAHALIWEEKLLRERGGLPQQAQSA